VFQIDGRVNIETEVTSKAYRSFGAGYDSALNCANQNCQGAFRMGNVDSNVSQHSIIL
jgi:hypothetical protein